jgi:hypothetical protein
LSLTPLTVLRERFSPRAVILIVRVPTRPSRPKTISIPRVRRKVCARRSRPASAGRFFGQPDRFPTMDHDLRRTGRRWICVDEVLDRIAPVIRISGFEGARRSKCALTGYGPEREVGQPRQIGAGDGFVDEDQSVGIKLGLIVHPCRPRCGDVRPILLGSANAF